MINIAAAFFDLKSEPNSTAESINTIPIVRIMLLVPIQEIRKNPVTNVPMIAPKVENA